MIVGLPPHLFEQSNLLLINLLFYIIFCGLSGIVGNMDVEFVSSGTDHNPPSVLLRGLRRKKRRPRLRNHQKNMIVKGRVADRGGRTPSYKIFDYSESYIIR